jgi:hypothetical protein
MKRSPINDSWWQEWDRRMMLAIGNRNKSKVIAFADCRRPARGITSMAGGQTALILGHTLVALGTAHKASCPAINQQAVTQVFLVSGAGHRTN